MRLALAVLVMLIPSLASAQIVKPAERNTFVCYTDASTATSITALGGQCAAPGATKRFYITDIAFGASGASSTTADSAMTIKYGTGGTCGSGTTRIFAMPNVANSGASVNLQVPIIIPRNNELCWIHTVAGTKWIYVAGYIDK